MPAKPTTEKVLCVIPARYASSRFPGKPLAPIAGKPMIQWVCERAAAAETVDEVLVATDDSRIREAVRAFGGRAVMTRPDHPSGTDRIAEAVRPRNAAIIVNLQGDEPLMPPEIIDRLVRAMQEDQAEMGTVAVPFDHAGGNPEDPNRVKVVLDARGFALYFSRAPIPFPRPGGQPLVPLWHWGLYAYRRDFLDRFVRWPPGRLEQCEKLEQLRALENGARIRVVVCTPPGPTLAVDTPEDLAEVARILENRENP